MAATKAETIIFDNVTLAAAAADDVNPSGDGVDLTAVYSAHVGIKLLNGGTAPANPARVRVEIREDNAASSEWIRFVPPAYLEKVDDEGHLVGPHLANDERHFHFEVPMAIQFLRLRAGKNTGQAVTIDAEISRVTAI